MSDNKLVRNNKTHYLALISVGNEVLHTDSISNNVYPIDGSKSV